MGGQKQRGVALIVVMLIVAMVVIIATNISSRNQLSMRRTLNLAQYDQAYWYALSAEELAMKVLKQDFEDSEGTVHLQQYWALANVAFPAEYGEIVGEVQDMRACFNVNAVGQASTQTDNGQPKMTVAARQFQALLISLGVGDFGAEKLTYTLKDYIDQDTLSAPYGAEDAEYESRNVPYRAANTLMQHRSELRAVLGFSQDVYLNLSPYVCAIPGEDSQLLNVNTIKVEQAALLAGMLENKISVSEAENIINNRPADGYEKIEEFWESSSLSGINSEANAKSSFVVDSQYFLLKSGAKVDNALFRMESVLKRNGNNLDVLTRQYGGQQ
ncbi:MAG: type II secretion system minor pseudopilin GspK [Shewanella psychromarinicola]|jgi:general secretion pathway protein K|uniref:Type II secretion system protein K n=2 Tax=Gammaproteobacteria TaxID=1236 RepID=A0A3N4E359_9GAMM|nr:MULTISPECIES: type II secretion system minor pseudopilin GspK [Shewanella]AZG34453.1 general secretion pathway protein GspK [Shewanella psychromarinicola]MCL1081991.1 type II secretion system minor pseudopilin GspK [Shewanella psychromarinicola]PKG79454.1 general secretion pathway protein GspK [Shewanella sp. Actino-trap-3]RPA32553.1 general secretion pathway protein GspK [Shewanella psychromarinicola]|tara:strand:- start:12838 stop:13824 length:987 start_codon:yes stop_codon:yes gene_type:complete